MKCKKLLSMLLTGAMAASLLAGCGGNPESEAQPSGQSQNGQEASGGGEEGGQDSSGNEGNAAAGSGEMTEITVVLRTLGTVDESASAAVEEAVNEITQSLSLIHI